jgi:hypothetical protein
MGEAFLLPEWKSCRRNTLSRDMAVHAENQQTKGMFISHVFIFVCASLWEKRDVQKVIIQLRAFNNDFHIRV